jgi:uncharacterized Zn finger protein
VSFLEYGDYVSVADRQKEAAREVARLKKKGQEITPVVITGQKISQSVWGKAWCANLERYSDFESRLPRGRSYVRNGSVIHLKIKRGQVLAMVSGSEIYDVEIDIVETVPKRWKAICTDCSGSVGSLVELLQGRLSNSVMERVCRAPDGLFPGPREIRMSCSCPDSARMCKHVAAVLYGVGARLDSEPALLFTLRGVDHAELVADVGAGLPQSGASSGRILANDDMGALFGIEMESAPVTDRPAEPAQANARSGRLKKKPLAAAGASAPRRDGKPLSDPARKDIKQLSATRQSKQASGKPTNKVVASEKLESQRPGRVSAEVMPLPWQKRAAHIKELAKGFSETTAGNPVTKPPAGRAIGKSQAAPTKAVVKNSRLKKKAAVSRGRAPVA